MTKRVVDILYTQVGAIHKITRYSYYPTEGRWDEVYEVVRAEHGADVQMPHVHGCVRIEIWTKMEQGETAPKTQVRAPILEAPPRKEDDEVWWKEEEAQNGKRGKGSHKRRN